MKTYEETLKDYDQKGIIPLATIVTYAKWKQDHRPRRCPYCNIKFSVNLVRDAEHIIHCPVCCMEIEYEKTLA